MRGIVVAALLATPVAAQLEPQGFVPSCVPLSAEVAICPDQDGIRIEPTDVGEAVIVFSDSVPSPMVSAKQAPTAAGDEGALARVAADEQAVIADLIGEGLASTPPQAIEVAGHPALLAVFEVPGLGDNMPGFALVLLHVAIGEQVVTLMAMDGPQAEIVARAERVAGFLRAAQ